MASTGSTLVLGFYGEGSVHRDNTRALLTDFIKAYHHTNKGAKIRFVFAAEPFTQTMVELADFALTSGYGIGLVGHAGFAEDPAVQPFWEAADGMRQALSEHTSMPQGIVDFIGAWSGIGAVRLMLLSNPENDDNAYIAVDLAMGKNIPVRSLLNGLDLVTVTPDNDEEEQPDMRRREMTEDEDFVEEEEEGVEEPDEEYYDSDDDSDDEAEEEPDDEDEDEDEDEPEEADEDGEEYEDADEDLEEPEEEGDEEEPEEDDDEPEEEDDDVEEGEEEDPEDEESEEDYDDADEGDEEEEEEVVPAQKVKRRSSKAAALNVESSTPLTTTALTRLANRDRDAFYELAAYYDVFPGRGQKTAMMVDKILRAAGKTPAKKAAAPAKKAPVKKAPAAKKVAPRREAPAPAKRVAAKRASERAAGAQKTAAVKAPSSAIRKAAIKAMGSLIALLEEV